MRHFILISLMGLATCYKANEAKQSFVNAYTTTEKTSIPIQKSPSQTADSFQDVVNKAISTAHSTKNVNALDEIYKNIKQLVPVKYRNYWESYILYQKAIILNHNEKNNEASKTIDKAIEIIEENLESSEDYALLALEKSFSMKFANMMKLSSISSEVTENAEKAIKINPNNPRAYYVIAINNLYTPKMFGGMTKVEDTAKKGLSCQTPKNNDYYAPMWGRKELYEVLIAFYKSESKTKELNEVLEAYKKEFS